jgi:hypothetical protein
MNLCIFFFFFFFFLAKKYRQHRNGKVFAIRKTRLKLQHHPSIHLSGIS